MINPPAILVWFGTFPIMNGSGQITGVLWAPAALCVPMVQTRYCVDYGPSANDEGSFDGGS